MLLGGFAAPFGVIPGCITSEKYKRYYHTPICLVRPWLEKKFKWSTLFFFDLEQACAVPYQLWDKLPADKHPKKPALLMEDTFDGRAFAGLFRSIAQKYGYQFALDEVLAVGSKDYSAQIIKAKNAGVDAILIFTSDTDCITFIRQMKESNFSVSYMHGWKGTWAGEFYKALGKDGQYILCDGFWSMDFPYTGAKELGERYYKDFGKYSVSVGATYALCQILWHAIEDAGTLDGAKVRQAVLDGKFETVMGPVKYGEDGVAIFTSTASQWWDGKQQMVYPLEFSNWKLKLALDLSIEYAKAFNAEVLIVTSLIGGTVTDGNKTHYAEEKFESLQKRFEAEGIACSTELLVRGLSPGEDIVKYAEECGVNSIIIGVKSRSGASKILFGSNAQYIILKARCPVVTVKSESGKSQEIKTGFFTASPGHPSSTPTE